MTMVSTAYQTALDSTDDAIVEILTSGFSGQLKGWWDNYVSEEEKHEILTAVKTDAEGNIITTVKGDSIPDAVNTLIMAIIKHFIGDPSIWKDRSGELLSNLKCRTLGDFRWYKDTFLTRVYTRDDSNQPFWKEKFLAGLPKSLGDKVREKIRSQFNGDIPYGQLSYGNLIAYVQKVALKICQDDKIQKQLAKEKAQNRKDLGNFCQQFGLPCSKDSGKPTKRRKSSRLQLSNSHKPGKRTPRFKSRQITNTTSRPPVVKPTPRGFNPTTNPRETRTCFKCGRKGHLAKFCRISSKVRELNLDSTIQDQLNNLLINSSDSSNEDVDTPMSSSEDIQADDDLSSSSDESSDSPLINVIHNDEQNLLLDVLKSIQDPHERDEYLEKLKTILHKPNKSQLDNSDGHESDHVSTDDDTLFNALINHCSIQKFYIDVTISVEDFVLKTIALFDTGADSNCILEGLIPTKYFHKTSEKLRTASGSRLEIQYKLPSAIIQNDNLQEINDLISKGLIRKSKSPWSCAAFYVNKASEIERGAPRLVINYKPLNQALQWIRYPIPNKKDLLSRLYSAKIFSKFDMKSGFWQIQINPSDRYKTAFTVPFGQYEWNVMPFGLKNAPSEFQNIMNDIFNPYSNFCIVYIDDVLIFSSSIDQHFKHLEIFFKVIKRNGLAVSKTKICLFQTKIKFLGHEIFQGTIRPICRVIEFADKFPNQILEKTQLQRFLGCLNYVSDFFPQLSNIIKPLHERLKKSPPPWTTVHTNVVRQIKQQVKVLPCLYLPNPNLPKIVETDASDIGYGGVLKQAMHDSENCIAFTSKHWNKAQQNYSTVKKEVLAIVLCISKFQSDLLNQKFLVRVDCKSAKDILQKDVKNLASKQIFARWQAILSVFDFDIEYIKGTSNTLPDYLTREFLQGKTECNDA
uniref:Polyprotein n=1 Tax=Cajanus cajan TaxID=3821 RepID=A0A151R3E4_CAJCA|nr:polyprotein [Cajanus cajan]